MNLFQHIIKGRAIEHVYSFQIGFSLIIKKNEELKRFEVKIKDFINDFKNEVCENIEQLTEVQKYLYMNQLKEAFSSEIDHECMKNELSDSILYDYIIDEFPKNKEFDKIEFGEILRKINNKNNYIKIFLDGETITVSEKFHRVKYYSIKPNELGLVHVSTSIYQDKGKGKGKGKETENYIYLIENINVVEFFPHIEYWEAIYVEAKNFINNIFDIVILKHQNKKPSNLSSILNPIQICQLFEQLKDPKNGFISAKSKEENFKKIFNGETLGDDEKIIWLPIAKKGKQPNKLALADLFILLIDKNLISIKKSQLLEYLPQWFKPEKGLFSVFNYSNLPNEKKTSEHYTVLKKIVDSL